MEKAKRRTYTAAYKRRILSEADRWRRPGELGALLRREGLHHSHLRTWRRQLEEGILQGLGPKKRGRKGKPKSALEREMAALRRKNARLERKLAEPERIIELQRKSAEILEMPLRTPEDDESGS